MKEYLPRIADIVLSDRLEAKGAVLIEGPKWCGKTTTALQKAKSVVYMQDPLDKEQNLALAELLGQSVMEFHRSRYMRDSNAALVSQ